MLVALLVGRLMLLARIGGAAFHGPMLGRMLSRGLLTVSTAAAAVVVPLVSKLELCESGVLRLLGARFGLGMAIAGAVLTAQPDEADCMPPSKRKERATVPEVPAVMMSEEELAAAMPSLIRVPVAIAQPQEPQSSSKKGVTKSRVYEAYVPDPTDSSRCLCPVSYTHLTLPSNREV